MLKQAQLRLHSTRLLRAPQRAVSPLWLTQRRLYSQETANPEEREQTIHDRLAKRFQPSKLMVEDVSGGCGAFYAITISSKDFKGLTTVKQHRLVNDELKDVIQNIHGLQLKTIAE